MHVKINNGLIEGWVGVSFKLLINNIGLGIDAEPSFINTCTEGESTQLVTGWGWGGLHK